MKRFSHYLRLIAALLVLGAMLAFGMAIFVLLLFVAFITSIILSMKSRPRPAGSSSREYHTPVHTPETITIIEGEAHEVTPVEMKEKTATAPSA